MNSSPDSITIILMMEEYLIVRLFPYPFLRNGERSVVCVILVWTHIVYALGIESDERYRRLSQEYDGNRSMRNGCESIRFRVHS